MWQVFLVQASYTGKKNTRILLPLLRAMMTGPLVQWIQDQT